MNPLDDVAEAIGYEAMLAELEHLRTWNQAARVIRQREIDAETRRIASWQGHGVVP